MTDKPKGGQAGPKTWGQRTGQQQQQQQQQRQQHKANGSTPPPGAAAASLAMDGSAGAVKAGDLIQGLLGPRDTVLVHGKAGSGKSAILRALAFHIAGGLDWCGRETLRGFVAYISPDADLAPEFEALAQHHGRQLLEDMLLRTWAGSIDYPDHVADKIEEHAQMLGECRLAIVDVDHGRHRWPEAEELAVTLRERIGCAAILTAPRPDLFEIGFDAVWSTPLPAQTHLCVLQIDKARRRNQLGRLTFRFVSDQDVAVVDDTPERPTLRPKSMTAAHGIIWEAMTLRAYEGTQWRFTFDQFKIICLSCGLQLDDLEPKRLNERIKRYWDWFLRQKTTRWDEATRCAVLNPEWRDSQRYADIGASAEALYEAVQRNEARTEPH
ncbi:MAG: hypothetical protein K0R41_763 [Geminicoccaceae bacterium]|jgi:hypothetical protein|nr:hypothetical protein [Geminicoccaceae bacterium]